jgi:hypothetical protein
MKTMETIIERLRTKRGDNGCYYLLGKFVEQFEEAVADSSASFGTGTWLDKDAKADIKHTCLDGFIWGLRAGNFITDDEKDEALKELREFRWPREKEETAPAGTGTASSDSTTLNISSAPASVNSGAFDG